jgi:subtilisin family serine protease
MAPGASLIALQVLDAGGRGSFRSVEKALQWCITNSTKYNIVAINMSLGDGSFQRVPITDGMLSDELAALANLGIIVVSASGNDFSGYLRGKN